MILLLRERIYRVHGSCMIHRMGWIMFSAQYKWLGLCFTNRRRSQRAKQIISILAAQTRINQSKVCSSNIATFTSGNMFGKFSCMCVYVCANARISALSSRLNLCCGLLRTKIYTKNSPIRKHSTRPHHDVYFFTYMGLWFRLTGLS